MRAFLKCWVSGEYWRWPDEHIKETRERGPSVRISPDSVPADAVYPMPIIFCHPRGTMTAQVPLFDVVSDLIKLGHIQATGFNPNGDWKDMDTYIDEDTGLPKLALIDVFANLDRYERETFTRLVDKYGILFLPAATHYSYITHVEVV